MLKKYFLQLEVREEEVKYNAPSSKITSPEDVFKMLSAINIAKSDREHFLCIYLDVKGKITGYEEVAVGGVSSCFVEPRTVFRGALLTGASAVIVAHNHPSGDLTPSTEDIDITDKLKEAGKILGIPVVDHVIVSREGYLSIKEEIMVF